MIKYKIVVEYEGSQYHGWQRQKEVKTIQEELEIALKKMVGSHISIFGASRTDSGVHAYGQVAHFELKKPYHSSKIQSALNYYLKTQKISIVSVEQVSLMFHARFSSKMKTYVYKIINRKAPLTIHRKLAYHIKDNLNIERMREASTYLVGTHDFTSFRTSGCQSNSPIKTIEELKILELNDQIHIKFVARSFLYNQIRIMVGTLKIFGVKDINPKYMEQIISSKNRSLAGPTAPSCGLYLHSINYN